MSPGCSREVRPAPLVGLLALVAGLPLLLGAEGSGCGGVVSLGGDGPCFTTGCAGTLCDDHDVPSTCAWTPELACYKQYGACSRLADGACGWTASAELDACLSQIGPCDAEILCAAGLTCVGGLLYPTACGPANCDVPVGPCSGACDPSLGCVPEDTCYEGALYPTACGPANCDPPIGACDPKCDPTQLCSQTPSCYEGLLYPSACGPFNCDAPSGPCGVSCDPGLACPGVLTCENGLLYPTSCGSLSCDAPLGPCAAPCDASLNCASVETCFQGMLYPTSCGPSNCDVPAGPCPGCSKDPGCPASITCEGGLLFPTGCGASNCDAPIGTCCPVLDAKSQAPGCGMVEGYTFDGLACSPVECGCVGADCGLLYPTELACSSACYSYF